MSASPLFSDTFQFIKEQEPRVKIGGENFSQVEYFGRLLLLNFFQELGFFKKGGDRVFIEKIKKKINLISKYDKLFEVLLVILENEKLIQYNQTIVTATEKVESSSLLNHLKDLENFKANLIRQHNDMSPHFNLLEICIRNYHKILSGEVPADNVMFPVFSLDLVKNIFVENLLADYFNEVIARLVYAEINSGIESANKIKILEIGAGTGGTSIFVANKIAKLSHNCEYYFTDISNVFVKKARKKFIQDFPFMIFQKFDIESSSSQQGFERQTFDIIFASNVIHSTSNINHTLQCVQHLLKENGLFILNEVTNIQDFVNLTFGLLDGWWKFEDPEIRIPHSPLLTVDSWQALLRNNFFKDVELMTTSHQEKKDSFSQSILISRS